MKLLHIKIKILCLILVMTLAAPACKKAFDVKPEDEVDASNAYQTSADADAAVIGIYGKLLSLSKQYLVLNELRADLEDVTGNADPYLQEINIHQVTAKNPYANPRPFYELIANCNDALKGFTEMVKTSKISVEDYQRRYSDIGTLRSWLYLQLGIHYGSVPYITRTIDKPADLKELSAYPKLPFNVLLDSLVNFTAGLQYNRSQIFTYPTGNPLNTTVDNNATAKFYIVRTILMGDLYLWKGDYHNAAINYKLAMEAAGGNDLGFGYRVAFDGNTITNTVLYNGQDTRDLYLAADKGWRSMFSYVNTNRSWNAEWYWSLPFSSQFKTKNPLPGIYSTTGGSYFIKPSTIIIDKWNAQLQPNGSPGDPRGMMSYTSNNGAPVITKFTDDISSLIGGGQWNIWRAPSVHLHYAEAANRDGMGLLAWGLLNNGIGRALVPAPADPPTFEQVEAMLTKFPEPYLFDARNAGATNTGIRGVWYRNIGIRGRGYVRPLSTTLQTDLTGLENALIDEASLELAFEGQRWPDLLRIAMRRDNPGFLADKVYEKLSRAGNPAASTVRTKLLNKDWYLPFDIYN